MQRISFKGHRCFRNDWVGFDASPPVKVIIGRNNTGKSQFLELVEAVCRDALKRRGWKIRCNADLTAEVLKHGFLEGRSGGGLIGDHWGHNGHHLVGTACTWELDADLNPREVVLNSGHKEWPNHLSQLLPELRPLIPYVERALGQVKHPLGGATFLRILADRDIQPEGASTELHLRPDGRGATNIVRRFLNSANTSLASEVIEQDLLDELNSIWGIGDQFTGIEVREHDDTSLGRSVGEWEIYLRQEKKGLIPLSNSGSGLKTLLLVLLNTIVIPKFPEGHNVKPPYVLAFEELENNLHPAILRRLLEYLEAFVTKRRTPLFLTTHSSTVLDFFGSSASAEIIHVMHDGESAVTEVVGGHFDKLSVLSALGARPSDLLQANGIIWVEGPSDRIYINRWIELLSDGLLREGRDYQCVFYGGALLGRTTFGEPSDEPLTELVSVLRINPNVILVCDSDRDNAGDPLKPRVLRVEQEMSKVPGGRLWITQPKEIENYLSGKVLAAAFRLESIPDPGMYERFFPAVASANTSFLEQRLQRKSIEKVELAIQSVPSVDTPNPAISGHLKTGH